MSWFAKLFVACLIWEAKKCNATPLWLIAKQSPEKSAEKKEEKSIYTDAQAHTYWAAKCKLVYLFWR